MVRVSEYVWPGVTGSVQVVVALYWQSWHDVVVFVVEGVWEVLGDRAVKREDITAGSALLGLSVEEHVGNCLSAMQAHAAELGLGGNCGAG